MTAVAPILPDDLAAPSGPATSLLAVDHEFGAALTPDERAVALRRVAVELTVVAPGPWAPGETGPGEAFAYVVVEGLLRRETALHDRRATELFGPGDVIDARVAVDGSVPVDLRWAADTRAVLAVLDARFLTAMRVWPALALELHRRVVAQSARTSVHAAIAQLGRVDLRVLALLWHLADRWGLVTPDGIVVPLRLTHALLGRLVGAQRPTVTLALAQLAESGDVTRREDGAFVLRAGSADQLTPVVAERAGGAQGAAFCTGVGRGANGTATV